MKTVYVYSDNLSGLYYTEIEKYKIWSDNTILDLFKNYMGVKYLPFKIFINYDKNNIPKRYNKRKLIKF